MPMKQAEFGGPKQSRGEIRKPEEDKEKKGK
jgi:hypothetical protein